MTAVILEGQRVFTMLDYLKAKYDKATLEPNELAHEAGRSGSHIRRMCQRGEINAVRIGNRWVIPIAECAALLGGGNDAA